MKSKILDFLANSVLFITAVIAVLAVLPFLIIISPFAAFGWAMDRCDEIERRKNDPH